MIKQFVRRSTSWALLGLLVLAFVLAACGGDSGSPSSTTSNTGNNATPAATPNQEMQEAQYKVTIKETKAQGQDDVYMCDPATLNVKVGESVEFTNQSDEEQDFGGTGDAMKAGVDLVVKLNGTKTVTFNTAGTFTLKSAKGATITITVQ